MRMANAVDGLASAKESSCVPGGAARRRARCRESYALPGLRIQLQKEKYTQFDFMTGNYECCLLSASFSTRKYKIIQNDHTIMIIQHNSTQ